MNKELRQKLLEQLGLEKGEEVVDALIETYNNYELHEKPLVVIDYLVSTKLKYFKPYSKFTTWSYK